MFDNFGVEIEIGLQMTSPLPLSRGVFFMLYFGAP
jgi:hypothetical protein